MKRTLTCMIAALALATSLTSAAVINLPDDTSGLTGVYAESHLLGTTISNDSAVYLVGTMKFVNEVLITTTSYNVIRTATAANDGMIAMGQGWGDSVWGMASGGVTESTIDITTQVPTLLVMRIDQVAGENRVWINPDLTGDVPLDATADIVRNVENNNIAQIHYAGNSANVVEYTDVSVYYGGDTPFNVPEPATMSLLALGGVAMLRRRKK